MIYVIQLLPDIYPKRYKIGFSKDPNARLEAFKNTCPFAKIVATFPAKMMAVETMAHGFLSKSGACVHVANEVYDADDGDKLVAMLKAYIESIAPAVAQIKPKEWTAGNPLGRRHKPYVTSWGEAIDGLCRDSDGRWRIAGGTLRFSEADERKAIDRFRQIAAANEKGD